MRKYLIILFLLLPVSAWADNGLLVESVQPVYQAIDDHSLEDFSFKITNKSQVPLIVITGYPVGFSWLDFKYEGHNYRLWVYSFGFSDFIVQPESMKARLKGPPEKMGYSGYTLNPGEQMTLICTKPSFSYPDKWPVGENLKEIVSIDSSYTFPYMTQDEFDGKYPPGPHPEKTWAKSNVFKIRCSRQWFLMREAKNVDNFTGPWQ